MSKLKLYIAEKEDFSEQVLQLLNEKFEVVDFEKNLTIKDILKVVDVFWFRLGHKINHEVLNKESKCRYLVTPVTGIDHIDEKLCNELGIDIICLRGEYEFLNKIRATAELTIALTLSLLRNINDASQHTKDGLWQRGLFRGSELYEKKVGIIGYGRLGKICGDYFLAFGCEVIYFDIEEKNASMPTKRYENLFDLLKESDVVSIHLSLNDNTRNFINKECFNHMKINSILINTSRGGIIDESAMLVALKSKKIKGAALDVLQGEPEIKNHPLIEYSKRNNNLIITPHIGGNTYESFEKTEKFIAEKLIKAVSSH